MLKEVEVSMESKELLKERGMMLRQFHFTDFDSDTDSDSDVDSDSVAVSDSDNE